MEKEPAVLVRNDEGRVLRAFGDEIHIHLDGEQTGGKLTMWTGILPPGGGPPLHYHLDEDEIFHVLAGRVAFFLDDEWREAGPGGSAFMPRGRLGDSSPTVLVHAMRRGLALRA